MRVALPLTAAASGTVASINSCPEESASLRLARVSDWLRKGTLRTTMPSPPAARAASALSCAVNTPSGTIACARSAVSAARAASREPIAIGTPVRASRSARPKPSAPEAPITATGSTFPVPGLCDGDTGLDDGTAAEYRLRRMPSDRRTEP